MITLVWAFLNQVTEFKLETDYSVGGMSGTVQGKVNVIHEQQRVIFNELGAWVNPSGKNLPISNRYCWQLLNESQISLAHLRFGSDHPILLATFQFTGPSLLTAQHLHQCSKDFYSPTLQLRDEILELHWKIWGPHKQGTILCRYTT